MKIGDKVRLKSKPACQDVLGLREGQVGIVRNIDATCDKTTVLISFAEVNVYTSALRDEDFEVIRPEKSRAYGR
jgi:hypothetical protein